MMQTEGAKTGKYLDQPSPVQSLAPGGLVTS